MKQKMVLVSVVALQAQQRLTNQMRDNGYAAGGLLMEMDSMQKLEGVFLERFRDTREGLEELCKKLNIEFMSLREPSGDDWEQIGKFIDSLFNGNPNDIVIKPKNEYALIIPYDVALKILTLRGLP